MSIHDLPVLPIGSAEELKYSLASELDNIGTTQQDLAEVVLQDIIQSWQQDRTQPLPNALIYPVRRDATRASRNLGDIPEINDQLEAEEFSGASFLWEVESHAVDPLLSVGSLDERGQAVCRVLTELPLHEELELFLTQYDQARGDHQEAVDYMDLLGRPRLVNLSIPHLDTLSSSHCDCDMVSLLVPIHYGLKFLTR